MSAKWEREQRKALGLRSDAGYVDAVRSVSGAPHMFGIALTATEASTLAAQNRLEAALADFLPTLTPVMKQDLAGMFIARGSNPVLVIRFARNASSHAALLTKAFPIPGGIRVESASYTQTYLDSLVSQIANQVQAPQSLPVRSTHRDDVNNRVVVDVGVGEGPRTTAWLHAHLGATAPVLVVESTIPNATTKVVVRKTNPDAFSTPPLDAGIEIWRNIPGKPGWVTLCSTSFYAVQSATTLMFTAGHCAINGSNASFPWAVGHAGQTQRALGPISQFRFASGTNDSAIIPVTTAMGGYPELFDAWTNNTEAIGSVSNFGDNADIPGSTSCTHGVGDDGTGVFVALTSCGYIMSTNVSITYPALDGFPQLTLTQVRATTALSYPGMSGGPVVWGNYTGFYDVSGQPGVQMPVDKATGIISGKGVLGGTEVGFYTHIRYAMSAFTGGAISLNLL